ncbi:MAG: cell division protein FtsW [Chloroflexi bacterium]|nr:cell division protein FtsW [Chloroflexota bacterium]
MALPITSQASWFGTVCSRLWTRNVRPADYVLTVIVGALLLIGVMMIYSVSVGPNLQTGQGDPFSLVERHLVMLGIGLCALVIGSRLDYHLLQRGTVWLMFGTLALLVAVLIFGEGVQGAKRWLIGPSIQPGEIAKLVTIIYVAAWLASKGKKLRNPLYGLLPFSILVGIVAGFIILQPNYSTAMLIAAVAFTMFFIAGADLRQFIGSAVVTGGVATLIVTQSARAMARFGTLIVDPAKELNDGSWQIAQTLIALASGGVFGKGLGTGGGQYGYVPLAHSDGIFAIWGEETGLIGAILLVGLFVALAYRGFRIAQKAPDDFGRVLAAGITFWLVLQAFVNIGVVTQLIPFTGQPLPFISYGGSSLVMSMASVGILLSISRALPKPPVVKSVPVVGGATPVLENSATTKKNATISYRGRDRRTRVSTRRRSATPRRRPNSEPDE